MMVLFFMLWNAVIAYMGIELLGFEAWLRLTWSLIWILCISCTIEVSLFYTIQRSGKRINVAVKGLADDFRNWYRQFRSKWK